MKLGPGDLVLCSGTLAPDVGFRDRVAAAAEGGFAGISLWGRDYRRARDVEGLSDADIRALLDDHGLAVAELDGVWSWTPGADRTFSPEHDPASFFRYKEDDLYGIGDAVGARSINAVDVFGGDWGVDAAAEAFAALCDRASEHGLLQRYARLGGAAHRPGRSDPRRAAQRRSGRARGEPHIRDASGAPSAG